MNYLYVSLVIASVSLSSGLIIYFRAEHIIEPEKINELGLDTARRDDSKGFALLAIMFGILVTFIYAAFFSKYDQSQAIIALFTIIVVILLDILAWKLRSNAGLGGIFEVMLMNTIWGISYGIILPQILENGTVGK